MLTTSIARYFNKAFQPSSTTSAMIKLSTWRFTSPATENHLATLPVSNKPKDSSRKSRVRREECAHSRLLTVCFMAARQCRSIATKRGSLSSSRGRRPRSRGKRIATNNRIWAASSTRLCNRSREFWTTRREKVMSFTLGNASHCSEGTLPWTFKSKMSFMQQLFSMWHGVQFTRYKTAILWVYTADWSLRWS